MNKKDITREDIIKYREDLICEMCKQGSKEQDLSLVTDELIINSIVNNRKPEDVAWAVLQ